MKICKGTAKELNCQEQSRLICSNDCDSQKQKPKQEGGMNQPPQKSSMGVGDVKGSLSKTNKSVLAK